MLVPISGVKFHANILPSLQCTLTITLFYEYFGEKKFKISRKYSRIPVLSNYAGGLESHVRERYLKKISVVGVDPVAGSSGQFNPPIAVSDLLSYSVLETSYYANSSLKHLKVLKRSTKWCLAS